MTTTQTQAPQTQLNILSTMPGAHVVRAAGLDLAVGFPEEVVKSWMKAGIQPGAWLIPDTRSAHGVVQWALEFPLYHALFVRGTFGRGEKVPVLCTQAQWNDLTEYLRLTLLGPSREEMVAFGTEASTATWLANECTHLALKRGDGKVAQMEDFLQPLFFNAEGVVQLGALSVRRHGADTWSFYTAADRVEEFHLEIPAGQQPVYAQALPNASSPLVPQPLELIMLGASNGFDAANPCSNMVVQSNGRFLLVDAGPYIRTTLRAAGVGVNQVGALVITHTHEDHAVGLNALLETRQRIRLFISAENAGVMRRKLAILNPSVASPSTLLEDTFDVCLITSGADVTWGGMTLRFHHTFHSIPCTGLEVRVEGPEGGRRMLLVGDHDARAHVEAAAARGLFSAERLAALNALYTWEGDLLVADAGEGAIHGAPVDFAESPAQQVVYVHTGKLKDADRARFTLARPGYRYTVLQEQPRAGALERSLAQRALVSTFPGADMEALTELLDAASVGSVNTGHVVVRQGGSDRDLYVVLSGEMAVQQVGPAAPRELARIDAGELFGERAAINGACRAASVVAVTPARLMRIPQRVFARFCQAQNLGRTLPGLWEKRSVLDGVGMLSGSSITVKDALASAAKRCTVAPGTTLIREKSSSSTVYVLVAGRVQVYKGDAPLLVQGAPVIVEPGTMIGETAPFMGQPRNASIVALDECEVLAIRGPDFKKIVEKSPQLFCHISRTVKQRAAA
jgi:CRP-like cAMP-binding protein/glyoxylase-like metal-dependent hydrolase (beta-lactamase superfamily II)